MERPCLAGHLRAGAKAAIRLVPTVWVRQRLCVGKAQTVLAMLEVPMCRALLQVVAPAVAAQLPILQARQRLVKLAVWKS